MLHDKVELQSVPWNIHWMSRAHFKGEIHQRDICGLEEWSFAKRLKTLSICDYCWAQPTNDYKFRGKKNLKYLLIILCALFKFETQYHEHAPSFRALSTSRWRSLTYESWQKQRCPLPWDQKHCISDSWFVNHSPDWTYCIRRLSFVLPSHDIDKLGLTASPSYKIFETWI